MPRQRGRRAVPRLALNQQEAAEALGMSVDAFEKYVKLQVPCVYVGSRRLFAVQALQDWLDSEAMLHGRRLPQMRRRT